MALLAGSRLAGHTLALTTGSQHTLSEIFPAVEHIRRFNLRTDVARQYLGSADSHLASMAITYVQAVHEDFVSSMISLARNRGISVTSSRPIKAWNMHSVLFGALRYRPSTEWEECFHLLRHMRNSVAHAGGKASQDLVQYIPSLSAASSQLWQRINNQPPADVVQNGAVVLVAEHIFCSLAVAKALGREINTALQSGLRAQDWAEICVSDYVETTSNYKNSENWRRGLVGFARFHYSGVQLTEGDLEAAARALSQWTLSRWK